ncbi:MAG: hypothetical protein R3257_03260, partial [bacterium]|nr:hypothetical protein [bacterium]
MLPHAEFHPVRQPEPASGDFPLKSKTLGNKLEGLSENFLEAAFDPAALGGMMAAGLAYQGGRLWTMTRLAGPGFPRLLGGKLWRASGVAGGFAAEVPAFTLSSKGIAEATGHPQDWSGTSLKAEMASAARVLGPLKLGGLVARGAAYKIHGVQEMGGPLGPVTIPIRTQRVANQGGMLGGLMVGHAWDAKAQGQGSPHLADNLMNSLATLLQFNVAGKTLPHLFPGSARAQHRLEWQIQEWSRQVERAPSRWNASNLESWAPALAGETGRFSDPELFSNLIKMVEQNENGTPHHIQHTHQAVRGKKSRGPAPHPFELLETRLKQLIIPRNDGSLRGVFPVEGIRYHFDQERSGGEIRLQMEGRKKTSLTPDPSPKGRGKKPSPETEPFFEMTYYPDGRVSSINYSAPSRANGIPHHWSRMTVLEKGYNDFVQNILHLQLEVLFGAKQLFIKLETALGDLRGEFDPKEATIRYDNFVALRGERGGPPKVFSFEIQPGNGKEPRIRIYENTGKGYQEQMTLGRNGTLDQNITGSRIPLPQVRDILLGRQLVEELRRAARNPQGYAAQLESALSGIRQTLTESQEDRNPFRLPTIVHSMVLPSQVGPHLSPQGDRVYFIDSGVQLWKLLGFFGLRAPKNRPIPKALRKPMVWEMIRWGARTYFYILFWNVRNPKPKQDYLSLRMHRDGSGELKIYRKHALHDMVLATAEGETQRMNLKSQRVTSLEKVEFIETDHLEMDSEGNSLPIRDAEIAFQQLLKIPALKELHHQVVINRGEGQVQYLVDFPQADPVLNIQIRQYPLTHPEGQEVPRVDIIFKRGLDTFGVAFEDGVRQRGIRAQR